MKAATATGGPLESDRSDPPAPAVSQDRLWTPWRMHYVAGGIRENGCIFCNRLAEHDDVQSLIVHRGDRAFVIMNLYPYNTGHVMIVPTAHVGSPEDADAETMTEMAVLRGPVLRALRRALSPEGFNLGLNVGTVAGAGVTDHLHEHVVPRWQGDANFMPILASTMVMPELLPVTYAKLRAEIEREIGSAGVVASLALSDDRQHTLVDSAGVLPKVAVIDGEPVWRSVLRDAYERGATDAELLGWAGDSRAGSGKPALLLRTAFSGDDEPVSGVRLASATVDRVLAGPDCAIVLAALQRLDRGDPT